MLRVLRGLWDIVREILLAMIWQPSRPGPTEMELQTYRIKQENLAANMRKRANTWDTAERLGKEAGKVAMMQPTPAPQRPKPKR